jgi:hypothetical protein
LGSKERGTVEQHVTIYKVKRGERKEFKEESTVLVHGKEGGKKQWRAILQSILHLCV